MCSKVPMYFFALAKKIEVEENDSLLLQGLGISTAEKFSSRIANPAMLEAWLSTVAFTKVGIMVDDKAELTDRGIDEPDKEAWLTSDAVGAIRRLWEASKEVSKVDLAALTSAQDMRGGPLAKPGAVVLAELRRKADAEGIQFSSDKTIPGDSTIALVRANITPGGPHKHLEWELYINLRDDNLLQRTTDDPRKKIWQMMRDNSNGAMYSQQIEVPPLRPRVNDILILQDVLELRANAHIICGLVSNSAYLAYNAMILKALRQEPPVNFRPPSLLEVRMVDREVHQEIYRWIASGDSDLEPGLIFYSKIENSPLLKLLEFVSSNTPERGVERASNLLTSESAGSNLMGGTGQSKRSRSPARERTSTPGICRICHKTKAEHPRGKYCVATAQPKAPPREAGGSQGKGGQGKGAAGKSPPPILPGKNRLGKGPPQFMANCAARTLPTADAPSGVAVCYDFNNTAKGCRGPGCKRSHACPVWVGDALCGQAHPAFQHNY